MKKISIDRFLNNSANWIMENMSFVLFLMFLMIFYIANNQSAERKVRKIQALQKELKVVRSQTTQEKASLSVNSRLTEMEEDMEYKNLQLNIYPPLKIVKTK